MGGRLAGYGPTTYNENGYTGNPQGPGTVCAGNSAGSRTYGKALLWSWDDGNYIGSTRRHWFYSDPYEGCTDMVGIGVGGDSGGSLYDLNGTFCGVVSGDGYWSCDGSNETELACEYHTVAVNDANAIAWWSQHILDNDGHWEGEIPVTPGNDPDGDGIASAVDNCPLVWNPEQRTTFDDVDGNGVGAACEVCPTLSDPYNNRNREVELAVRYPTATAIPVLKRSDYVAGPSGDQEFAEDQQYYLQSFVPDACDPFPAPTASIGEGGHLPPDSTEPVIDFMSWPCMAWTQGCESVLRNKITIYPVTSAPVTAAGGSDERIGLRWCDCKDVDGFANTIEGRALCRNDPEANCDFAHTRYTNTDPEWLRLTTPDLDLQGGEQPWDNPVLGQEWVVPAGGLPFSVSWDYTALGSLHVGGQTNSSGVTGILWAHVRELTNPMVGLGTNDVRTYANALTHGGAGSHYGPSGHLWVAINDWVECPMCTVGIEQVLFETGNPWWRRATPDGLNVIVETATSNTRAHFDAVGAGTRLHVPASEPVALLGRMFAPQQTYTRALGLTTNGAVAAKLLTKGLEGFPVAEAYTVSGGPTFSRSEGVAFSALEQRLYVLGGQTAGGQPKNKGWFLNLATSSWREFTMPSRETVGAVLSMTYRHNDRSIYFLDKSAGTLRLRRWNAQRKLSSGVLVTLATFPASWNDFNDYSIIAGPQGDLAVVAWNGVGSEKTRIGRFTTSNAHRISMAGLSKLTTHVVAPPTLTYTSLAMTVDPNAPRASSVMFTAMQADWQTDAATVQGH